MRPLNYAILKHMTTVEKASAEDVIDALKGEYGSFKMLNKSAVLESLMTAEQNGLVEKCGYEMGPDNEVRIYFCASQSGAATINFYIK